MPIARFQLPDGRVARFEVPEGTSPEAAQQMMELELPSILKPPAPPKPETTLGGNLKEFAKGIVPGAVGLAETAATGASALLPEDMEKSARKTISETAAAVKKPFEAEKGYEESVGRRLGEGVGSTLPFFLLGPAGAAGRAVGAGIGAAAGAGEARQEAEAKGQTGDARMWATALGAPVGLLDLIAPQVSAGKSMIINAFKRGGMEGATEAAQKVAQNLIAKGLYDPSRSALEGSGEEGAYGAGTGAIISFLLDATLGKKGRGAGAPPAGQATTTEAEQQARRVAREQEQMGVKQGREARAGEKILDTEEREVSKEEAFAQKERLAEMDRLNAEARAQREADLKAAFPTDYADVMQRTDAYVELSKELDAISGSQTKEAKARRGQIQARMQQIVEEDTRVPRELKRIQDDQERLAKQAGFPAKKSAAAFEAAPPQMEMREAMLEPGQELPPQRDLQGNIITPEAPVAEPTKRFPTFKNEVDARRGMQRGEAALAKEATALRKEQEAAGQMTLAPRVEPKVTEQPVTPEPTLVQKPEPLTPTTVPTTVTPDVLGALGIGRTAIIRKPDHGIMGKDIADPAQAAEVKSILEAYRQGRSAPIQEKIDAYLARPEFQTVAPAQEITKGETDARQIEPPTDRDGVQVSDQTGEGKPARRTLTVKRNGMVSPKPDVGQPIVREAEQSAPIEEVQPQVEEVQPQVEEVQPPAPPAEPKKQMGMFDQLVQPDTAKKGKGKKAAPVEEEEAPAVEEVKFDPWDPKNYKGLAQEIEKDTTRSPQEAAQDLVDAKAADRESKKSIKVKSKPIQEAVEEESTAEKDVRAEATTAAVKTLTGADKMVLAKHYKQPKFNKVAETSFVDDTIKAINEGIDAVAKAIHKYVRKAMSGILSAALVINPAFMSLPEAAIISSPATYTVEQAVKATIPAEAAKLMSPAAKTAYETILPAIKADLQARDKLFIINDKPSARTFLFTPDGQLLMQSKTLQGVGVGDLYKGNNDIVANRVTPAGLFNIEQRVGGKTAGEYDFGKVFGINDTEAFITIMHSVWTKEADAPQRLKALNNDSAADSRYSFGCINVPTATFKQMLEKHENQMNGAKMFIVPDNQARVKDFISGDIAKNTVREDKLLRQSVEPVTEKVTKTTSGVMATPNAAQRTLYGKPEETVLNKAAAEVTNADKASALEAALQAKVAEGDIRGALKSIIDADPALYNDIDRLVAKRLLLSGSLPTVEVVGEGALGMDGDKIVAGQYDAITDTVRLVDGYVGAHTLLHELVHGFLHRAISAHEGGQINNAGVRSLRELYDYVGKQNPALLKEYGMTNLSEFASEAMSNKDFQAALQKIPYRRQSILSWFGRAVLKALGISETDQHTALVAALISAENVMSDGRALQVSELGKPVQGTLPGVANVAVGFTPQDYEEANRIANSLGPAAAPAMGGLINNGLNAMNRATENSGVFTTLRQALVDKYATVESKVSNMFSKGVRDAFGNLNPMVLVRQAEDHAKVFMSFLSDGGIKFNKEGLVETFKQKGSAVQALSEIDQFGKDSGLGFEKAKEYVSSVLEGHRAYDIQENHNKPLEVSALGLEQQGKNKEADAERAKKIRLHLTAADIAALEAKYQKTPAIQKIQDTFNQTRMHTIDLLAQSGRISKEQADDWKANSAYVPFDRVMEDVGVNLLPRGKGLGVMTKTPEIKGSLDRRVKDVVDSYMGTLGWMVEEAMRHNASTKLLNEMDLAGFAEKHPTINAAKNKNLVVRLYEDGKPVFYEVQNEYDLLAFKQAPEVNNLLVNGLAATSRFLRVSVTAMPPFAVKQVVEDATRAAMYSGVERPLVVAMKTLYNMPRIFFGEVLGRKSPAAKRMEELGIVGDYDFNIYQPTSEIEKEIGAKGRGTAGTIFHMLEKFTKASDLAARMAVYEETMRESGGDEVLAQTRARELINFQRRGSSGSMRVAARVIPFFNAYAQGMDVLYRAASGIDSSSAVERTAARRLFMGRVAMMTALGFAYAMAMSDDDGYKNATDDVRDSNWLLPNGYKLPTPKELGFMYKVIPERIVEYYRRQGTPEEQSAMDALSGVMKAAYSAYSSPTTVPSYVRPILENMTNYSFFLQRELESASMQRLQPGQRFTSSTSELAKSIGEATNVSPIKIDNMLKGMFGMAGSTTLLATDAMLNPTRPDRPIYQMPFGSIFTYDTIGGRAKTEFYDLRERVSQADATYKEILKHDPEKAMKFYEENAPLIAIAPQVNKSLKELSDLRRLRTAIERGTDDELGVDGKERRNMIDELRGYENESVGYVRELQKLVRDLE
jgi:hypothetical protein